ncbi:MAG: hypothetical protein JWO86_5373 [Myxococcaceae bacterium]|nr:hypothetical protein [Myxococcaceae bacterium]
MALLLRRANVAALALALAAPSAVGCDGCQGKPTGAAAGTAPEAALDGGDEASSAELDDEGADGGALGGPAFEAGSRFRDAGPKAEADRDGPVDPACVGGKGSDVALATVVVDARCAIGRVHARHLRALLENDAGPPAPLRQEAKLLEDGRIVHRLVNVGPAPLTLPLIFSASLPAFLVMAENEGQTLYELATPRFDVNAVKGRAHFARIVLEPGGAAVATITPDLAIASVVARRGGDRADAGAATLPKGHYVLRVGELLTDVEAGAPARVPFDVR